MDKKKPGYAVLLNLCVWDVFIIFILSILLAYNLAGTMNEDWKLIIGVIAGGLNVVIYIIVARTYILGYVVIIVLSFGWSILFPKWLSGYKYINIEGKDAIIAGIIFFVWHFFSYEILKDEDEKAAKHFFKSLFTSGKLIKEQRELLQNEYDNLPIQFEAYKKELEENYGNNININVLVNNSEEFYSQFNYFKMWLYVEKECFWKSKKKEALKMALSYYILMLEYYMAIKKTFEECEKVYKSQGNRGETIEQDIYPINPLSEKIFIGCSNLNELHGRWKELQKIYHPDNDGDTEMIQMINQAYDEMKRKLKANN